MVKMTTDTPGGDIEVEVINNEVHISVGGFYFGDIVFDNKKKLFVGSFLDDGEEVRLIKAERKGWFAAGKPEYIQRVCEDIELVMDEKEMDITDEQMIAVAEEVVDNYGNEDYNEYIAELLEDIKQVGEA